MAEALSALQLALLAAKASEQRRLLQAEPIAIVGMGCRLPAGPGRTDATTPEAFWQLLCAGGDAVGEVPPSRWPLERYYDPTPGTPGRMHCRHGGFLAEIDQFDPGRFGLSPKEAAAMDPQHRLLMEVAAEALEAAALAPSQLRGTRAGVYLGLCTGDYAWRQLRDGAADERFDMYFATGTSFSMAPGRLAYAFGLQGPAIAVDTACSSSLVAVDLAVRSLRDRCTDLALAGGVSLLLSPVNSLCFAKSGMMAADGHCKTFDAAADGYVRGEGCGVVVLKRLSDAVAAGDPIWAVLRGSGVNQDGTSAGLTVPNGEAQARLIRSTLEQAQLDGDGIDVLEAHGTGTPLGDPIELKALAPIYGRAERAASLLLGSVKTNLGHLEGAAGIAGLIKAVLMVQRGQVPAHLHLRQPTPFVPWDRWAMRIPTALTPWPQTGRPRRAAVSSFGFSGTNAHVIVEQAPAEAALPWPPVGPDWLVLSAGSPEALERLREAMADWLERQDEQAWGAICASSRAARSSGRCRLALQAPSPALAAAALRAGDGRRGAATSQEPRLAWALADGASLGPARAAMEAWAALRIVPTALIHGPVAPAWLPDLVGHPPQLRLAPTLEDLSAQGYATSLPLTAPSLDAAVRLWLAGASPAWSGFEPPAPWPRQVLPTTPFSRSRCWVEEDEVTRQPSPLDLERRWQPLEPQPQPFAGELVTVAGAELEAPPALDGAFWQSWLPRLQQQLQAVGPVHWVLEADPQTAAPQAQAIAALLRTWLREAGAAGGALLWAGPQGRDLNRLQQAGLPPAGAEWRWGDGRVEAMALLPAPAERCAAPMPAIQPVATYLITGGLGALGLATARWLAQRGARHLLLVARRPADEARTAAIAELEALGCRVDVACLDVADGAAVRALLEAMASDGRPLHGIVHAAGILDDGLLLNQTPERCAAVAAAKLNGALALDAASRDLAPALEFFVCYSSVAALLGSPGQASYAAANGALDGLMARRRREGLHGLSLNWGPWAGEGMASRAPQLLSPIQPGAALESLGRWLGSGASQGVVVDLRQANDHRLAPRCRALLTVLESLPEAEAPARQAAVQACLADLLADLGGFDAGTLAADTRLDALGLDSLMAVELATAVQAGLGVSLGLGALAGDPTLASLAAHLLALLEGPAGGDTVAAVDLGAEARLPEDLQRSLSALPPSAAAEAILLTGATGFLGAFLLADQLERHPQRSVYCLVRADGAGAARGRVRANLDHYGLWRDDWAARIVALPGDLALPGLGLDPTARGGLLQRLGGILHNGAQLSYVAPYGQLRAANVGGTLEVLRLAAEAGVPLEFISSTSVYEAAAYRGRELDESSDLEAWQGIHLGYSQTKWVSERLVWQAARSGLPVRLYRPPLIAGHSRTGAWHEQDFLHRLVRGCLALGLAPELPMELDLVPVDYVTAAIGALAWTPLEPGRPGPDVLHLHHPHPVLWSAFLDGMIRRGAPLRPVPLPLWLEALAAAPSNPLYPLQPFFTHRWGPEQLTYPELNQPDHKARPSCRCSLERLQAHGVQCPDFEQLVDPYARTFLADLLAHG
ncbi:MAG: thioester reductase domain-containing protein [Synechococcus sp. ELA057]